MKNVFEYKGYLGSAELDAENLVLVGKLLFIRDVITYSAEDAKGLDAAFREAVDDYLQTCVELGEQPDTPCKGSFNVRVGPDLHRDAALYARSKGVGLNELVCDALRATISSARAQTVEHHYHVVAAEGELTTLVTGASALQWRTQSVRTSAH